MSFLHIALLGNAQLLELVDGIFYSYPLHQGSCRGNIIGLLYCSPGSDGTVKLGIGIVGRITLSIRVIPSFYGNRNILYNDASGITCLNKGSIYGQWLDGRTRCPWKISSIIPEALLRIHSSTNQRSELTGRVIQYDCSCLGLRDVDDSVAYFFPLNVVLGVLGTWIVVIIIDGIFQYLLDPGIQSCVYMQTAGQDEVIGHLFAF